jgi:hypothetical protein
MGGEELVRRVYSVYLDLEALELLAGAYPGLKTSWRAFLVDFFGTMDQLRIQRPNYYWKGDEVIYSYLSLDYKTQNYNLILREVFGYLYVYFN